jgi:hypothetical protein
MSHTNESAPDLVRWTFSIDPARREAIESHLDDLGADVLVRDGRTLLVSWDEPEASLDGVIEAIWKLHGDPFEVTQEEFHRIALHSLSHSEDGSASEAA